MVVRRKDIEACVFCEHCPCTCEPIKPSPRPKRKINSTQPAPVSPSLPSVTETRRQSARDRMVAAASAAVTAEPALTVEPLRRGALIPQIPKTMVSRMLTKTTEDLVYESAIRALEPLMSNTDKLQYKEIIDTVPSLDERAKVWVARREGGKG